jgi:hypothetical protein
MTKLCAGTERRVGSCPASSRTLRSTVFIGICAREGRVALSGWVTSHAQKCAVNAAVLRVADVEVLASTLGVALPNTEFAEDITPINSARLTLTSQAN